MRRASERQVYVGFWMVAVCTHRKLPCGILDIATRRERLVSPFVLDGHSLPFVSLLDVDDGTTRAGNEMRVGSCAPLWA